MNEVVYPPHSRPAWSSGAGYGGGRQVQAANAEAGMSAYLSGALMVAGRHSSRGYDGKERPA
jgi:hypothetical protein